MAITYYQPRTPVRYESGADDTDGYDFPRNQFEFDLTSGLYVPTLPVAGGNFAGKLLGDRSPTQQNRRLSIRYVHRGDTPQAADTALDAARAAIAEIPDGRLIMLGQDGSDDVERWAYAHPLSMPSVRWQSGDIFRIGSGIEFELTSTFKDATITNMSQVTVNGSTETFTITNPGNATVYDAVFTLDGDADTPILENLTSGDIVTLNYSLSSEEWELDCGRYTSTIEGVGAWNVTSLPVSGVYFIRLLPGVNNFELRCTGTPAATLDCAFYGAWH